MTTGAKTSDNSSRTSIITVALCYLVALFEGFDLQAAGVAAPRLGPAFQMSPGAMGWFFSSSTFGLMLGAALGGWLSDRIGRKSVLIFSVGVFGLMSVLTGLASNVEMLVAARFLTGLGIGGALPILVALVAENTPAASKNTAVGLLYAGLPSGGATASVISVFGSADGWQTVFFVGGIAPLALIPLLIFVLPESKQLQAEKQAHAGESKRAGFAHALLGGQRAARSMLLWVAFFLALLTMYLLLNWLPTLLVSRGLSRADASLVQVSFNVLGAFASVSTGLLLDRVRTGTVVILSFGVAAASLLWLASNTTPQLIVTMAMGGLVGMGMSATQAILYSLAQANYPTQVRGTGVGSSVAIGRLGSAVGPLLAAVLLSSGRTPQQVLVLLVPTILMAGISSLLVATLMRRADARSK